MQCGQVERRCSRIQIFGQPIRRCNVTDETVAERSQLQQAATVRKLARGAKLQK